MLQKVIKYFAPIMNSPFLVQLDICAGYWRNGETLSKRMKVTVTQRECSDLRLNKKNVAPIMQ